jgi:hypothetical protein
MGMLFITGGASYLEIVIKENITEIITFLPIGMRFKRSSDLEFAQHVNFDKF